MGPEKELRMEIDGTTYVVSSHYTEGEESIVDKITRLVKEDENIVAEPAV